MALAWAGRPDIDSTVLDAGCGTGGFLAALKGRGFAGRAVGLDLAVEALERARSNRRVACLAQGSVSRFPIASESLDLVVLHDVLQHLPAGEDRNALDEAFRSLKPGGRLLLRANVGSPIEGSEALRRRYDAAGLASLVRSAGFRIETQRLLHPVMALLGRLRGRGPGHDSHGEAGLAAAVPPGPVNAVLDLTSRIADALVIALPFRMPWGDVQVLRARKPPDERRSHR